MIRTLAFAWTLFSLCSLSLQADEPSNSSSNAELVRRRAEINRRQATQLLQRLEEFHNQGNPYDGPREAQKATIDDETLKKIRKQLNGTWKYIAQIRADAIATRDEFDVQLVIHDDRWGIFIDEKLSSRNLEKFRILTTSDPIAFVQPFERPEGLKIPDDSPSFSFGILKVVDDHLMMTSTPARSKSDNPFFSSGEFPDFFEEEKPIDYTNSEFISHFLPKRFSPEGTENSQSILRRVSDSTELLDQIANKNPDGAAENESDTP
jgi:hypothetical protein